MLLTAATVGTIGIIGVVASILMEGIKKVFGTSGLSSKIAIVVLSIVLGGGYYFLKDTNLWVSIIGVLSSASAVYAFFIKK